MVCSIDEPINLQGDRKVIGCDLVASPESEACEGDRTTFAGLRNF
jgi:hypothetical protein